MSAFWIIILSVFLIGLDLGTKYLASAFLAGQGGIPFIPGVLEFFYTKNYGAAFSIMSGYRWILVVLTGAALLGVFYILMTHKLKNKWQELCLVFVFSGGIGNLIDRLVNGYVVDFFHTVFMDFPIFNVADIFICVGIFFLFILLLFTKDEPKQETSV